MISWTGSQSTPWADTRFQSCQGMPNLAASIWTDEIPGMISTGQISPKRSSILSFKMRAPE